MQFVPNTRSPGDHILPALNGLTLITSTHSNSGNVFTLDTNNLINDALIPGQESSPINSFDRELSFGEKAKFYHGSHMYALISSTQGLTN